MKPCLRMVILVGAIAFSSAGPSQAGPPYSCMLAARGVDDAEVGYRLRGDRCEGLFVVQVYGEMQMSLVGLHLGKPDFNLQSPTAVPISVPAPGADARSLSLRVSSRDDRIHYQMDTDDLDARATYRWSTDVVRNKRVDLGPEKLAAVACTNRCQHDADTKYFPVVFGAGGASSSTDVTVIVRPTVALSRLQITIVRKGTAAPYKRQIETIFPANESIPLAISRKVMGPGENEVTVVGYDRREMAKATWFGHLEMPAP